MNNLLTATADYDTPGSWDSASRGWPEIVGDNAYSMYVFANCVQSIPYGSYVLIDRKGRYGAKESILRAMAEYKGQLEADFMRCGCPTPDVSIARRNRYGKANTLGNKDAAPLWEAK